MPAEKPAKPINKAKRPAKPIKSGRKDFSQIALSVVERATGGEALRPKSKR